MRADAGNLYTTTTRVVIFIFCALFFRTDANSIAGRQIRCSKVSHVVYYPVFPHLKTAAHHIHVLIDFGTA